MTNKRPAKRTTNEKNTQYPRKIVPLRIRADDSEEVVALKYAGLVTSPELAAHRIITLAQPKEIRDSIDFPCLIDSLRDQAAAVNRGDLAQAEAMLINQAVSLQTLFVRLTERGMEQTHMANYEGFMRMALRAQSQCRATLETLATIKNPPQVAFVKQANIAAGPQQVNNGVAPKPSRAGENENQQSKQSGGANELLPDARASQVKSRINPQMETVGKIDRAENG